MATRLPEHTIAEIENIAKSAFALPNPAYALQQPLVDFVTGTSCIFCANQSLSMHIQKNPQLWVNLARMLTREESGRNVTEGGDAD